MVTENEAVENFLNGKRNLAAYQFCQLVQKESSIINKSSPNDTSRGSTPSSPSHGAESTNSASPTANPRNNQKLNSDEVAFNYAMINLFTGCPQRASMIFSDLVKRYPRNPRLWLRLAESMLATARAKLTEFEHIQQLANPDSRDHLIKSKNKPILVKINPNYCQQQIQQQFQLQRKAPANILLTIKGYLQTSLDLVNEYNDISLLTDDVPNPPMEVQQHQNQSEQTQSQQTQQPGASMSPNISLTNNGNDSTSSPNLDTNPMNNSNYDTSNQTPAKLSHQLSYANPYQSISRSGLYHLRNKVYLNLAYVCLCMGDPKKALEYTTQCLKFSPLGYEKILANLYHAEACILTSRVDEAIQFLNLEIINMAKSLYYEHPVMTGETKRVVYGDDMRRQVESGALATVITYNLSVALAAKGEFQTAHKVLLRSVQPSGTNPMQIIICLLYIQLQQGKLDEAKKIILSNLPQFR